MGSTRRLRTDKKGTVFRSAITGKFVSEDFYIANPNTTYRDTVQWGQRLRRRTRKAAKRRRR